MNTKARIAITATDETRAAFASVTGQMAALSQRAQQITSTFAGISSGIAALLGGVSVGALFKGITDGLDQLNDLRDATGASIGNLSALEDIAAKTGTSFETVSGALVKFNGALLNAKAGSEAAQVFERLGLSVEELRAQDPAEAFRRVAVALAGFANDGDKARATQVLFGRSLREVAPLLNDVAEAGQLNATVTDKQAQAAEEFNKRLSATGRLATNAGRAIVSDLLPGLNGFLAAVERNANNKEGFFAGFVDGLGVDLLRARLQATQDDIERLRGSADRAREVLRSQPDSIRAKATLAELANLEREAAGFRQRIDAILYGGGSRRPANEGGGALANSALPSIGGLEDKDADKAKKVVDQYGAYIERLRESLRATQQLSVAEQLRVDIAEGKLGDLTQAQRDYAIELANVIDLAKQPVPFVGPEIDPVELAERRKYAEELRALVAASSGAQFDGLVAATQRATEAYRQGTLSLQDYQRVAEVLGQRFEDLKPKIENVSTFTEQAARNIQDALGSGLAAALEGDFKSIEKLWANTIKQLVAQALAADLNRALFGATFGQKGGQLGGLVGAGLSFFGLAGARAFGGPVQAGRAYTVGERGPETFVPTQPGTIVPAGGMGGSVSVTQYITVGQGVSRGEVAAAALQAKDAAVAEIRQLMFRTGRGAV